MVYFKHTQWTNRKCPQRWSPAYPTVTSIKAHVNRVFHKLSISVESEAMSRTKRNILSVKRRSDHFKPGPKALAQCRQYYPKRGKTRIQFVREILLSKPDEFVEYNDNLEVKILVMAYMIYRQFNRFQIQRDEDKIYDELRKFSQVWKKLFTEQKGPFQGHKIFLLNIPHRFHERFIKNLSTYIWKRCDKRLSRLNI